MPFSKTRNDIVHMDAYHRDPKRESFKPLLSQIAEDLLHEGFENVGPQITKLTITDEVLTQYVDEFICYYYDSALDRSGYGASGIGWGQEGSVVLPTDEQISSFMKNATWGTGPTTGTPNTLSPDPKIGATFTRMRLDGEGSARNKNIDDYYRSKDWNKSLALNAPCFYEDETTTPFPNSSHEPGIISDGTAKANRNTLLGPNCELFHYINQRFKS